MKKFSLPNEELTALRAARKLEKNKQAAYKINAVMLVGSGWTIAQLKQALLLNENSRQLLLFLLYRISPGEITLERYSR